MMARKKKDEPEIRQWSIPCKIIRNTTVLVEARTRDEAVEKFQKRDWIDDGYDIGETVDWIVSGPIKDEG